MRAWHAACLLPYVPYGACIPCPSLVMWPPLCEACAHVSAGPPLPPTPQQPPDRRAGSKFRFSGGAVSKDGSARLDIGLTDVKAYRTTNLAATAHELEAKGKAAGSAHKFLADPLECTVVLESTDGFVPLLLRPGHAKHAPGAVDTPVGTPEPSAVGIPLNAVVVVGAPAKARRPGRAAAFDPASVGGEVVTQLFDSALSEVADELNLESEKVRGQTFLGVVRGVKTPGMLSAVFYAKYSGTLGDLQARYALGSKDQQSSALILAPATQLLSVNTTEPGVNVSGCRAMQSEGGDAAPATAAPAPSEDEDKTSDVNSDDICPCTKAALELWRMHKQKLAARRRSTAGFL